MPLLAEISSGVPLVTIIVLLILVVAIYYFIARR